MEPGIEIKWKQSPLSHWEARFPPPLEPVAELDVQVDMVLDVLPINPFDFEVDDGYELLPIDYPESITNELAAYRGEPRLGELARAFFDSVDYEVGGDTVDYLVRLTRAAADRVQYIIREEPGIQTPEETLQKGSGSCRDTALLLVQALRARGFAARFVSGYLVQLRDDGDIPNLRKGVSEDVLDLHAWAEAFLPGAGWVGLDGTSGLLCGEGHIPLACAVDPSEAAPISGTTSRAATGFSFEMQVERLGHEPTPLRPYTDEMWNALREAGDAVDAALETEGLPLTCGGEPTWTSREHAGDPEWLTEALGPTKWSQGLRMAAQIRDRMEPGALVMSRMGKHYPGESLPRWAIDVLSRRDGVPIWRAPGLLRLSGPRDVGSAEP